MVSPKYKTLFSNLIDKTQQGKVDWKRTSQLGRFQLQLGEQLITIYSSVDENPDFWKIDFGEPKAEFSIIDKNGREVDSVKSFSVGDAVYTELQPLYQVAKSSANNIDETIDNLLTSLEDL